MGVLGEIVGCASQLVKIPSESSGFTDTDPEDPEKKVRAFLETYLTDHGIDWATHEAEGGRKNLVAHFPASGAPKLLIVGHMDTVSAQGMENAFRGAVAGGKLHGRGACDDKGPLAAALCTLTCLHRQGRRFAYDVTFAATVDEECSLSGARALAKSISAWDLCIALEPTELRMITAHKGVFRFSVETKGRAAHASRPSAGANAIDAMLPILVDLQGLSRQIQEYSDPVMGAETLTVTMLQGGASLNVVPDRCEAVIDSRLLPETDVKAFAQRIVRLVGMRGAVLSRFVARGMRTDPASPIIRAFQASLAASGHPPLPEAATFATDCSELGHLGPCIVWGPGSITHAHSREEHVSLDALEAASVILTHFLIKP